MSKELKREKERICMISFFFSFFLPVFSFVLFARFISPCAKPFALVLILLLNLHPKTYKPCF